MPKKIQMITAVGQQVAVCAHYTWVCMWVGVCVVCACVHVHVCKSQYAVGWGKRQELPLFSIHTILWKVPRCIGMEKAA